MTSSSPHIDPKTTLTIGAQIIERVLGPCGFQFQFQSEGRSSGGSFAWGRFVRDDRVIELHFRHSLGLVTYSITGRSASHESYMRELGFRQNCRYPGFSQDPLAAFEDLAHDLQFANDFTEGTGEVLIRASEREGSETARPGVAKLPD
jgi:hypothetical protein